MPMSKPKPIALILILAVAISAQSYTLSAVPRKSPEFIISNPSDPSGKTTLLSRLKGKVVVLEFFFIQSNHCINVAKTLNKLNTELGPRGFQAVGIVFDPPNTRPSEGRLIGPTVNFLKLTYPIGFATRDQVDSYLGRRQKETLSIPQVVLIDRAGMIRAASGAKTDPALEDENSLRTLVDGLLKEAPPQAPAAKQPAKSKKTQH